MRSMSFPGFAKSIAKPVVVVLACVPMWIMAQPPAASFAGPSVVQYGETAEFSGVGFEPNSVVGIAVTAPGRKEVYYRAVVAKDGSLTYWVSTQKKGMHQLRVVNGDGKTLASLNYVAME